MYLSFREIDEIMFKQVAGPFVGNPSIRAIRAGDGPCGNVDASYVETYLVLNNTSRYVKPFALNNELITNNK